MLLSINSYNVFYYMIKFTYLICLSFILFQSQPQALPDPLIQILTRIITIGDLIPPFTKGFCGSCDPTSSTCTQNFNHASQIPQIKFTLQNITANPDNITQFTSRIEEVNGSYSFPNPNHNLKNMSMRYVIHLPRKINKIKGVVLYLHSTVFGISEVPAAHDALISAISALYVSSGYAVVFPNYIGYQSGDYYPHPYLLYPWQNVKATILALNQGLKSIKLQYPSMDRFNLFAVGYEEGASYALWLEKCLKQPDNCQGAQLDSAYIYKGAAGLSGPYDILTTIKPFLTQKINQKKNNTFNIQNQTITNFQKPSRLAMTLISYIYYSGRTNYEEQFNTDFWQMQCTKPISQRICQFNNTKYQNLFKIIKSNQKSLDIAQVISFSAFAKSYNSSKNQKYLGSLKSEYQNSDQNSVISLVSEKLMNEKNFNDTLHNASAINNKPTKDVFLFSLKKDSVIPVSNTQKFESKYPNKVITYYFDNKNHKICEGDQRTTVNPVDLSRAQVLANIFALAFIKSINNAV